eukprot:3687488-Amphidinium_carterae.1
MVHLRTPRGAEAKELKSIPHMLRRQPIGSGMALTYKAIAPEYLLWVSAGSHRVQQEALKKRFALYVNLSIHLSEHSAQDPGSTICSELHRSLSERTTLSKNKFANAS